MLVKVHAPAPGPSGEIDLAAVVEAFELELVRHALDNANGNKAQAARMLGLKRTTLVEYLKRKGMVTLHVHVVEVPTEMAAE